MGKKTSYAYCRKGGVMRKCLNILKSFFMGTVVTILMIVVGICFVAVFVGVPILFMYLLLQAPLILIGLIFLVLIIFNSYEYYEGSF